MIDNNPGHFDLIDVIAILERTPASFKGLLQGLPEFWIRATEGEGTWSPYDVIGHLLHGEKTDWIPRALHILEGKTTPFTPFDRFAQFEVHRKESLDELLTAFTRAREENIATLKRFNLSDEDLKLQGMHPALGKVTLSQLLATWAVHDLDHVAQVARVMAKAYTQETGPWSEYLSILRDRT